ncbi:MAG: ROK family transcriptional regulator [Prolixibacteraceae bacterium]|nr:ROK family transcriptional regulator [Prolixibacteraceae bacterium]
MSQIEHVDTRDISASELNKIKQKKRILSLLHMHGNISAPELSKWLRISLPTCIALMNDLIASGYVKNIGIGESSGGRKPNLYGLPEDGFYVISCDFSRYYASMTICDCYNKFVTPIIKIDTHIDDPELVEKLFRAAQKLQEENGIPNEKIYGVGVDMPGLIDSKAGINFTIKDKKYQNISRDLKKRFNKLIYIDNDARMHAYGEFHFGAAKEYRDAIIIHWSWGLGLGIFVNGQLYSGNNGFAGEFSHIPMIENGDLCICGKRGCLETIASSNTIMKRVAQGFEENEISSLINKFKDRPDQVTPEDVISSARQGDEFCISILNEVGKAMGRGLSYIIQLLNPQVIVLSGPISKARQYVLSPVQQSLNRLCLEKISGNTIIIVSDLGDQSALLGTSEMVFQKVFTEMNFEGLAL